MTSTLYSEYDVLADLYVEMYPQSYNDDVMQVVEKLFLQHLPKKAQILDLCCGSGDLSQPLLARGYQVTGIDGSEAMLRYARQKAEGGEFILSDARFFKFSPTFHGAIAAGDSLNHIMQIEELKKVFNNVFAALLDNSLFALNISMEEMYNSDLWDNGLKAGVTDKLIWIWKQKYDAEAKTGSRKITIMYLVERVWQRRDYVLQSRVYSQPEVQLALEEAGFTKIKYYDLERDLAIPDSLGNAVFICRKLSST